MAMAGRGRGRGRGLLARDTSGEGEPRLGVGATADSKAVENGIPSTRGASTRRDSIEDIEHILERLQLDVSEEELSNLYHLAETVASSEDDVKRVTEILYSKFTSDREFAKTGAFICDKMAALEINGTKFRSLLLSMIQADYKDKENLRSKSISKFLNVLSFMCQIFGTMRTAGGEVFKPLVGPLYECFDLILDSQQADNDEYECMMEQLQSIGRDLELNNKEKMEQMMFKIRSKIVRNGATPQIKCVLLELFESHCRGWKELSNDVTRFYCDTMMDILTD